MSLIVAPAWVYCSSANLEGSPAPDSTTTLKPCLMSAWTPAGDSATRRSFWKISLGTPTVSCLYGIPGEAKRNNREVCEITDSCYINSIIRILFFKGGRVIHVRLMNSYFWSCLNLLLQGTGFYNQQATKQKQR